MSGERGGKGNVGFTLELGPLLISIKGEKRERKDTEELDSLRVIAL